MSTFLSSSAFVSQIFNGELASFFRSLSWTTITTPSADSWTSISTHSAPASIARWMAAIVFSGATATHAAMGRDLHAVLQVAHAPQGEHPDRARNHRQRDRRGQRFCGQTRAGALAAYFHGTGRAPRGCVQYRSGAGTG